MFRVWGRTRYKGFYVTRFDEKGLKLLVASTIISNLVEAFQDATRKAVEESLRA